MIDGKWVAEISCLSSGRKRGRTIPSCFNERLYVREFAGNGPADASGEAVIGRETNDANRCQNTSYETDTATGEFCNG